MSHRIHERTNSETRGGMAQTERIRENAHVVPFNEVANRVVDFYMNGKHPKMPDRNKVDH